MGKRGHFWCMIFQFACANVGFLLDSNFLVFWAGLWSLYHGFRYVQLREEKTDASD